MLVNALLPQLDRGVVRPTLHSDTDRHKIKNILVGSRYDITHFCLEQRGACGVLLVEELIVESSAEFSGVTACSDFLLEHVP